MKENMTITITMTLPDGRRSKRKLKAPELLRDPDPGKRRYVMMLKPEKSQIPDCEMYWEKAPESR